MLQLVYFRLLILFSKRLQNRSTKIFILHFGTPETKRLLFFESVLSFWWVSCGCFLISKEKVAVAAVRKCITKHGEQSAVRETKAAEKHLARC